MYDPLGLEPNPICVGACTVAGGIIGGSAGYLGGGVGGGVAGGVGGSIFGPGGTLVGAGAGASAGASYLGAAGAAAGSAAGYGVGQALCPEEKECDPPKGTVCYIIDRVPPSKPHYPIDGSHYHLWKMNQAPNGDCFWNKIGASRTAPPGAIACPFARPPR